MTMNVIINYSAGRPQDSRIECDVRRRMEYDNTTIIMALSLFESYCIKEYVEGSQIVITSIKIVIQ
jgi:hypothetical protein